MVEKYKKYDDSSTGLLKWLSSSEEEARKQQSEAIAAEPQALQKQLEETKARYAAMRAASRPSVVKSSDSPQIVVLQILNLQISLRPQHRGYYKLAF